MANIFITQILFEIFINILLCIQKFIKTVNDNDGFITSIASVFSVISIWRSISLSRKDLKDKETNLSTNLDFDKTGIDINVINKSTLKSSVRINYIFFSKYANNKNVFPLIEFQKTKFKSIPERSAYLLKTLKVDDLINVCSENNYWEQKIKKILDNGKNIEIIVQIEDFEFKTHEFSHEIKVKSKFYESLNLAFYEKFDK